MAQLTSLSGDEEGTSRTGRGMGNPFRKDLIGKRYVHRQAHTDTDGDDPVGSRLVEERPMCEGETEPTTYQVRRCQP